jgi:hypothetical protein
VSRVHGDRASTRLCRIECMGQPVLFGYEPGQRCEAMPRISASTVHQLFLFVKYFRTLFEPQKFIEICKNLRKMQIKFC